MDNYLRHPILISLSVLLLAASGHAKGQPDPDRERVATIQLQLKPGKYAISQTPGQQLHTIKMEGFNMASAAGKPMLPYKIVEIQLPEDVDWLSVKLEIKRSKSQQLAGTHVIGPAEAPAGRDPQTGRWGPLYPDQRLEGKDPEIYNRDAFFPTEAVQMLPPTTKGAKGRKLNYARVLYSPLQYNPATEQLRITSQVDVQISHHSRPRVGLKKGPACNYAIITTEAINHGSQILPVFFALKRQQGFSVCVATERQFDQLNGPPPNGRAEKIRKWLMDNWEVRGIEYVLLIGNPDPDDPMYSNDIVGDIPMKQVWHDLAGRGLQWGDATDWYYADLTGSWDGDGDGFYGESPWLQPGETVRSPLPQGISQAAFSARWTGSIDASVAGSAEFQLKQWQGAKLFLDGALILDHCPVTKRKSDTLKTIPLAAGEHSVVLEYFQNAGQGHVLLQWKLPGQGWQDAQGMRGEYFNNPNLSGDPVAIVDNEVLRKNWQASDYLPTGGVDLGAEVAVGRIPVYDADYRTLDRILTRIIEYQKAIPRTINWRRKLLMPMHRLTNGGSNFELGEAIKEDVADPAGFESYRIYDDSYGLTPPPEATPVNEQNVRNAWNQQFGMVTWSAHGDWRYADAVLDVMHRLSASSDWFVDQARPLLNDDFPPFTFQASCHTGNFYLPDCWTNTPACTPSKDTPDGRISLGFSLLRDAAVAVVAASEVSTGNLSGDFTPSQYGRGNEQFAYHYTKEVILNHEAAGDALKKIKYTSFDLSTVDQYTTYHQQLIYNLLGDPSTHLHDSFVSPTGMPVSLTVEAEEPAHQIRVRDIIPKLCLLILGADCPDCLRTGLCSDEEMAATFSMRGFSVPFSAQVVDSRGMEVFRSAPGTDLKIRFAWRPTLTYDLILTPVNPVPKIPTIITISVDM